jgi:hypothetical protein
MGQESMLRIVVPADASEGSFHWSTRWTALDVNGNVQGPMWELKPLQGRIVSPLKMKLEKEVGESLELEQGGRAKCVASHCRMAKPGVTGTAQVIWQGFPQGIRHDARRCRHGWRGRRCFGQIYPT